MTSVSDFITAHDAEDAANAAALTKATGQVGTLTTQVGTLTDANDALSESLSDAQGQIDALSAQIAALNAAPPTKAPVIAFTAGAAYGSNSDPARLGKMGCHRTYWTNTQTTSAVSTAQADIAAGRVPLLSFKVDKSNPTAGWASAAKGNYNGWATTLAQKLSALGSPIFLVVHHEPETDGPIGDWVAMQEQFAPIFDVPNVYFGICVTGWHQLYGDGTYTFDKIWPKGAIKFFAVDVYQSQPKSNGSLTNLDDSYWSKFAAEAEKRGVMWGVWETGCSDESFAVDAKWFDKQKAAMLARNATHWAYFDSADNSAQSWVCTPGTDKEKALLTVINA